jgi:hypothetical protein
VFEEAGLRGKNAVRPWHERLLHLQQILLDAKSLSQRIEVDTSTTAVQKSPKCPRRRCVRAPDFLDQILIGASRNGS